MTLVVVMPPATGDPGDDAGVHDAAGVRDAAGVHVLREEIDALATGGAGPNDPKRRLLEEDLESLASGMGVDAPPEPGVDLSTTNTRDVEVDRRDANLWDHGEVPCEPLPPDLLTAEDIAGATCRNEPQPDGSSRYVATTPTGTEHVVLFAADGTVTRLR